MKEGHARKVRVPAWECRCARCGKEWFAIITEDKPGPPQVCSGCKANGWTKPSGAVPMGRPPKEASKR